MSTLEGALERVWPAALPEARGAGEGRQERNDSKLYELVSAQLEVRVDNLRRQIAAVRAAVDADQPLERCWQGYGAVLLACEPLFEECLAVRQGAIARTTGLDDGICLLADGLVEEICRRANIPWRRFTVLGAGESYTYLSDVIRVRFPDLSTWDLPVAAHELGHHAALRLERPTLQGSVNVFQDLLAARAGQESEEALEEHFADAFAALTVGPAYAFTCLLMRFDPTAGGVEIHPLDTERARIILGVLRREADGAMDRAGATGVLDRAEELWAKSCAGAGVPWHAWAEDERLADLAAVIHSMLRDALPASGRYGPTLQARAHWVAEHLRDPHYKAAPAEEDRIVGVLNAAWLARIDAAGDEIERVTVSNNARDLLDEIARESVRPA